MESNEDDTIIQNIMLFTALLEDKNIADKKVEIEYALKSGADVNAADASNNDDTPLHIAISRKEKDIVKLLLEWNADILRLNGDDKSAVSIAKELAGPDSQEIQDLIKKHAKEKQLPIYELFPEPSTSDHTRQKRTIQRANTVDLNKYLKRDGTTGVGGQLYKTKMLSLVLLRASNDPDIFAERFFLGTNIPGTGVFYDICFRYNVRNSAKSIRLFMQCKHLPTEACMTETDTRNADGDWSLSNCLDSFLKIKEKNGCDINDPIFGEDFSNVEFNFVLYTSSKDNLKKKFYGNTELSSKINYLINTGKNTSVFRLNYTNDDIDYITKEVQKKRIISLAQCFVDYIFAENEEYRNLMDNQLIKTYHVVLALNVLDISSMQEGNHRTAVFCPHFFHTKDAMSVLLRETLCKLAVKKYSKCQFGSEELVNLFNQLPNVPSSDEISIFIGSILRYDDKNNKLKLMNDLLVKGFSEDQIQELTENLEQIHVTSTTVKEAILKAGEKKLSSVRFKVPCSFGNSDISIHEEKENKVFDNIVSVFAYLFKYYRNTKIIELNETNLCKYIKSDGQIVTTEFLQNDDGIGSAIGNLLVPDSEAKMLKFNTAVVLPKKAHILLERLKKVLPQGEHLGYYRLKLDYDGCPRISFNNNDYDNTLARYFLRRLWFYTDQAKEDQIDAHVKTEINKYYYAHKGPAAFGLRTHIDSIYSTFHDEIQKWWMVTPENTHAPYLTQESGIFRCAQEGVIDTPLLTLHHQMYLTKMKCIGIEFTCNAIECLQLDDNTGRLVRINTDCDILTAVKLHQLYKDKTNYNFMDFNYLLSLPAVDRNGILTELKQTTVDVPIVICGIFKSRKPINEDLNRIINIFKGNKIILVIANDANLNMKLRIPDSHCLIVDEMNDFIHFDEESQKAFAKSTTLVFQGKEVGLNTILDKTSLNLINAKILSKLLENERIEIGRTLMTKNYENIQDNYVPRWVEKNDSDDSRPVNSLDSIKDTVVLIISKHGMGKSTLLTHLALESKKADPTKWIVRINLQEYLDDFYKWQNEKYEINKCDALDFLCKASLKHIDKKTCTQLAVVDEKIMLNTCDTTDEQKLLELKLFLHYYNERKLTFLFYGFDYICPPFGAEAIALLKIIQADGVPMWISSHLVAIPAKTLEDNFGPAYKLKPIDETDQVGFFHKFWKTNMQLEKINSEVLSNISEFIEFMSGIPKFHEPGKNDRIATPWISMPVHMLYLMAVEFFQTEFSNFSFANISSKLKEHLGIDLNRGHSLATYMDESLEAKQAAELAGTPLHMYLAANYFVYKIKGRFKVEPNVPEIKKKWDLWRDTISLYERFVQHNINKLCYQGNSPDIDKDFEENKRKEFFERHKNLVLLAICKEDHLSKLLPADKINELKNTLNRIQNGEEKSPFVDCVLNKVPKFFHLMYAEYCAVEYLCDIMKNVQTDTMNEVRHTFAWDFVVNILLYSSSKTVRKAFDYKLKHDPEMSEITSSDGCQNIIFELLLKGNNTSDSADSDHRNSLQVAVDSGMNNLVKLLLTSLDVHLTRESVKSSVKFLQIVDIAASLFNLSGGNMPTNITNFFTDMRLYKFVDVLKSNRSIDVPLRLLSNFVDADDENEVRRRLAKVRKRLLDRVDSRFGLSEDNIDLFRHIAEKIRDYNNN